MRPVDVMDAFRATVDGHVTLAEHSPLGCWRPLYLPTTVWTAGQLWLLHEVRMAEADRGVGGTCVAF